ncbi:hypothetical protein [Clostridium saccharoperbutylacetonicum]|uniref:hypothetical protein n=1 Tax=Clostridium saccharoperbutylacetonicum TaxID=36745 RepID=UPI000983CD86|nr:hypothetical protein [Clostridium saccharoperbutylacetonicum]AQR94502.1 hypothetical protein CLSAP_18130 [Clostridium saccharoperbutylacetonicum]NSB30337.1 hypothetical protein [Clostridium saccharoperbutylacetonicum]
MKKFITVFFISLFLLFSINTVTAIAQTKTYSQGFYTMNDLGLNENTLYKVRNNEPYVEGLLIIVDSDKKIQQLIRIAPNSTENTLIPLKNDYKFIIYNNVRLNFS